MVKALENKKRCFSPNFLFSDMQFVDRIDTAASIKSCFEFREVTVTNTMTVRAASPKDFKDEIVEPKVSIGFEYSDYATDHWNNAFNE